MGDGANGFWLVGIPDIPNVLSQQKHDLGQRACKIDEDLSGRGDIGACCNGFHV
jgi:hypothetical protein